MALTDKDTKEANAEVLPKPEITAEALNAAAELLLSQLPEHAVELFGVIAGDYTLPIWQVVAGCLVSIHMEGRVSAFTLDPDWLDGFKQDELKCHYVPCGATFTPKRIGQLYCSNECGLRAIGQWHDTEVNEDDTTQLDLFPPGGGSRPVVSGGGWGGDATLETEAAAVAPTGTGLPDNSLEGVPVPSGNGGWSTETGLD